LFTKFRNLLEHVKMEYSVLLYDAVGTGYGADVESFDDLDEARLYAKGQLDDFIVVTKVCEDGNIVDFFVE
jgi:hypothetical protein